MIITICDAFYRTDDKGINHIYVMNYEITEYFGKTWRYKKRTRTLIDGYKCHCVKTGNFILGM